MIKKILNDSFLKNNIIFFIGSAFVSVLNYLYNPILGRLLPISEFGELQALLSLSIQLGIIINVIGMIVVNIAKSRETKETLFIIKSLQTISVFINIFIFLFLIIFRGAIGARLGLNNNISIFLIAIFLLITAPLMIRNSHLQAHHKFKEAAFTNIISSSFKIICGILLISIGFGVSGALGGLFFAQLIAFAYVFKKTKNDIGLQKNFMSLEFIKNKESRLLLEKELIYGIFIFIIIFSATALYTSDTLMVKVFFPAKETGEYAGVAAIARIIFFLTSSVSAVLLATINTKTTREHNLVTIKKALGFMLALGVPTLFAFYLFPRLIIGILMGAKFLSQASLLVPISMVVFFASINNLLFSYFIAIRKYVSAIPALIGISSTLLLLIVNHSIITDVIRAYIIGNLITLALLIIITLTTGKIFKIEKH